MSHSPQPAGEPPAIVHMQPYRPGSQQPAAPSGTPPRPPQTRSSGSDHREKAVRRRDVLSFEQIVAARNLRRLAHSANFIPPAPAIQPGTRSGINGSPRVPPDRPTQPHLAQPPAAESSSRVPVSPEPTPESASSEDKLSSRERTAIRRPAAFDPVNPTPSQRAAMQKPRSKLDKHGRVMNIIY